MSSQSSNNNMSRSGSQSNACLDPLDAFIDFPATEYEAMSYSSPSISPSSTSKTQFVGSVATATANNAMGSSSQQPMSGPSHQYDLYKQQTGIPTGALATTLALNQNNGMYNYGYGSGFDAVEDFNDFKSAQSFNIGLDMDMEFAAGSSSPSAEPAFFYPEQNLPTTEFVNPSAIQDNQAMQQPAVVSTNGSNVGRLWPGMHQQQAALAKAQAQQKQQQQLIQQQRQGSVASQQKQSRPKNATADPIVEEKISQLLNSMRQSSVATSEGDDASSQHMSHAARARKEEEDMDEDERLLASEEGKKLSSKERRQLRNKVSARAFRSRRKEYIGQLEGEIATKVNENTDLRNQNRALMEENTRLSDLTRMLLSSPSFSGFLDNLSANPAAVPAPQPKVEQQQQPARQVRKDVNPYAAQQQTQMHMAMIPEQPMDFSMLDLTQDAYSYQPQVFSVLSIPEPSFDSSILSGKSSNSVGRYASADEKIELPTIERSVAKKEEVIKATPIVDEEFDADPAFALFNDAPAASISSSLELSSIFGGIDSEKALARLELVDAEDSEAVAEAAMRKVERLCAELDTIGERLESMTFRH